MGLVAVALLIVGLVVQDEVRKSGKFRTMGDPISTQEEVDLTGLREMPYAGGPLISFETLKQKLPSQKIIVIDGALDKYGYINGIPASYLGYKDSPSLTHYFWRLVYTRTLKIYPERIISEENEAKNHGLQYIALGIGSKVTSSDKVIDKFVSVLDHLPLDTSAYFHCHHGKGRTSVMLVMADILKNAPQVALKDIVKRQYLLGSENLFDTTPWTKGTYGKAMLENRKRFLEKFYEFVCQRKAGGEQIWSQWNKNEAIKSWENS